MPTDKGYQRIREIGQDLGKIALNLDDDALASQIEEYAAELTQMSESENSKGEMEDEEMPDKGGDEMSDRVARRFLRKKVGF